MNHISAIDGWSYNLEFSNFSETLLTDKMSVELNISLQPRRYRFYGAPTIAFEGISEDALLDNGTNYLILGDPGSGKTTTIKRCIRKILNYYDDKEYKYKIPILFRVRDMHQYDDFFGFLREVFGLTYVSKNDEIKEKGRNGQSTIDYFSHLFEKIPFIIFIDGMDEGSDDAYKIIVKQLTSISRRVSASKFIVTCRSGASVVRLDGFSAVELMPLDGNLIRRICEEACVDVNGFLNVLSTKSYKDISDRPLLLHQLIFIYNEGYKLEKRGFPNKGLPDSSYEFYRTILTLLVEKWDRERLISRSSSYGMQTPDRKIDILSYLAFELTISQKIRFNSQDIGNVFQKNIRKSTV